jgi:hypothetical protein
MQDEDRRFTRVYERVRLLTLIVSCGRSGMDTTSMIGPYLAVLEPVGKIPLNPLVGQE